MVGGVSGAIYWLFGVWGAAIAVVYFTFNLALMAYYWAEARKNIPRELGITSAQFKSVRKASRSFYASPKGWNEEYAFRAACSTNGVKTTDIDDLLKLARGADVIR
jgi:hypothetical protein